MCHRLGHWLDLFTVAIPTRLFKFWINDTSKYINTQPCPFWLLHGLRIKTICVDSPPFVSVEWFKLDRLAFVFLEFFFALVPLCLSVCEHRLCQRRAFCQKDPEECLLLPDAFVKQANNRRLSFPPPLRGEGPGRRGEEVGTKTQPLYCSLCQISLAQASKRSFFLGNSAPWIVGRGAFLGQKQGDVATMLI